VFLNVRDMRSVLNDTESEELQRERRKCNEADEREKHETSIEASSASTSDVATRAATRVALPSQLPEHMRRVREDFPTRKRECARRWIADRRATKHAWSTTLDQKSLVNEA
jgi:hypothetical protein